MTTKIIPADRIDTAGTLMAYLRSISPRTPVTGFAELRHDDAGVVLAPKPSKKPKAKKAAKAKA